MVSRVKSLRAALYWQGHPLLEPEKLEKSRIKITLAPHVIMAAYDNTYSRFIAWAKILLPLVALALLSTLFLFSRTIDPSQSIPYSKVDIDELLREQGIGAPNYSGVTQSGTAVLVSASKARPDPEQPKRMVASHLTAAFETLTGTRIDIAAPDGAIDTKAQTVRLDGGVDIRTSTGYHVKTFGVTATLDATSVLTDGKISGRGPIGEVTAGQMILVQAPNDTNAYVLVFKGGVKLIYDPKK